MVGNSRWVHAMEWSGQKKFGSSPTVPFVVDGAEAGLLKGHGPLTFLRVSLYTYIYIYILVSRTANCNF